MLIQICERAMAIYFPCSKEVIAPLTILKDQESQKSRIWSFLIWRVLTAHFFFKKMHCTSNTLNCKVNSCKLSSDSHIRKSYFYMSHLLTRVKNMKYFFLQVHTCYCCASLTFPSFYIQFLTSKLLFPPSTLPLQFAKPV